MILLNITNQALLSSLPEIRFAKQARQQIWQSSFCCGIKFKQVVGKDAVRLVQDALPGHVT